MSRLTDLIREAKRLNTDLGTEIEKEVRHLQQRRAFGLNFERHTPEAVDLYGRPVRIGDKVRMLPPRGDIVSGDHRLWVVTGGSTTDGERLADLRDPKTGETIAHRIDDLVVVANNNDVIYPGLVSTGKVEHGGDRRYHSVINGENLHVLEALLYTHRGKVDAIFIDPPYNTGARDWKYNNDYVESEDLYRHSKWLAFIERRLRLAKQLMNPACSVLIVTIDEKEYARLALLLEQVFPQGKIQMVSSVTNPAGAGRSTEFSRTDEYLFYVRIGEGRILPEQRDEQLQGVIWDTLRRSDFASRRGTPKGGTGQFFPIYVNTTTHSIEDLGDPLPHGVPRELAPSRAGCVAVFPVRPDGTEMNWGLTCATSRERLRKGYLRVGKAKPHEPQPYVISYLTGGIVNDIAAGKVEVAGRADDGSVIAHYVTGRVVMPTTNWNRPSHDAQRGGTAVLKALLPDRRFPFPKSLYAVEDAIWHVVADKPDALVLDFFAGSGTTAHAIMRLNRRDQGRRQAILVTNNEVAAEEQEALRLQGLRPGDPEWETKGICDHITKPRVEAAITGKTSTGEPIKGDYKFVDEFPMADGFDENAEFFTLTYEASLRVSANQAFARIAPLLWLLAGGQGSRIDSLDAGWEVVDAYGVIERLDRLELFLGALRARPGASTAFIVTDDDRRFQSACAALPTDVHAVRLYESYLRNFQIDAVRSSR